MTIFIRKPFNLEGFECPACESKKLEDVSNIEYPNMFECSDCGIITQVKFDG